MKNFKVTLKNPLTYVGAATLIFAGVAMSACGSPAEMRNEQIKQFTTISVPYKNSTVDCVAYGIGGNGALLSCDWQGYHEKTQTP